MTISRAEAITSEDRRRRWPRADKERLVAASFEPDVSVSEIARARAAVMATLITAKMNDVDLQAWLADVLARIADRAVHRLDEFLPWGWAAVMERRKVAA